LKSIHLIYLTIFFFLPGDIGADRSLIRTNGRYKVPTGLEILPCEICPIITVCSSNMNSTLALDVTDSLRNRILRGKSLPAYEDDPFSDALQKLTFFLQGKFPQSVPPDIFGYLHK
jgi:hypothetical protein